MNESQDAQFAEGLQTVRGILFRLEGFLDAEAAGFPRMPLTWVNEAIEVVASLQEAAEPDEPTLIRLANEERAEHLARYLVNAAKRTGQEWVVVEQYKTEGAAWRGENSWHRALLKAEDGSTVRIYFRWFEKCWVRGQKVVAPK